MSNLRTFEDAGVELFGSDSPVSKPLSAAAILFIGVGVIALATAGWFGFNHYQTLRRPVVHVLNPLDIRATVTIGAEKFELKPRTEEARVMEPGTYDIKVVDGSGVEISNETAKEIPAFTDVVAYNIAGLGTLRDSTVTYRKDRKLKTDPDKSFPHVGETLIIKDDVDFVFMKPPMEISTRGTPPTKIQYFFGLPAQMESQMPWQWEGTIGALFYADQPEKALAMLIKVAALDGKNARVGNVTRRVLQNCVSYIDFPFITKENCGSMSSIAALATKAGSLEPPFEAKVFDISSGSGEGSGSGK
jgi:hypothetical protein